MVGDSLKWLISWINVPNRRMSIADRGVFFSCQSLSVMIDSNFVRRLAVSLMPLAWMKSDCFCSCFSSQAMSILISFITSLKVIVGFGASGAMESNSP